MARIRTIKPEFWDSPGIETLEPMWRLLYIAMWNWADDSGRGKAEARELMGFAFPRDEEMTLGEFRRGLGEVRRVFGVVFYRVGGRSFYSIPSWVKHQKIDKRSASRWPSPDEGTEYNPSMNGTGDLHVSGSPRESPESPPSVRRDPGAGTGEQGNRGTVSTSRPGEPAEEFALDEPIAESTFEVGSDDDPKWCEFWAAVPKKDGKAAARAAWTNHVLGRGKSKGRRIEKTDPDVMIAGMLAYSERVRREGTERRHIKMAEGWINDQRWEDEAQRAVPVHRVHGDPEGIWT